MIEFVRGIFVSCFKVIAYIVGSALITAFITDGFNIKSVTVFLCIWAFVGIVLFTFPNLLEKEV